MRLSNVGIYPLGTDKHEHSSYAGCDANHPEPLTGESLRLPPPCRIRDCNRKYRPNDKKNQQL